MTPDARQRAPHFTAPRIVAAALLVAAGALAVATHWAPPAAPIAAPAWDASLLERVFPGVPSGWVVLRLALVALLLVLAGGWLRLQQPVAATDSFAPAEWPARDRRLVWVSSMAALAPLLALPWIGWLPRWLQLPYVASLALPALILLRHPAGPSNRSATTPRPPWPGVLLVCVAWLAWHLPGMFHSPLLATPVDSVMPFVLLAKTLQPDFNLLTGQLNPGFGAILTVFQGAALLGMAPEDLTIGFMQGTQVFWLIVSALLLAHAATAIAGRAAALVAVAVFLFSPFASAYLYQLGALFLGTLLPILLLILWLHTVRDARPWALAGLGAVAGLATNHPSLIPVAGVALLAIAPTVWRQPGARPFALIGMLSFLTAALPNAPSPQAFGFMVQHFARAEQMWAGMEATAIGAVAPSRGIFHLASGASGTFDAVAGALLSPWATPRTTLRHWGDVMIEPLGAAFFAIGLAMLVVATRRSTTARVLLAWYAATILPGIISSYDRPSLTRALGAPVVISLVAGLGFRGTVASFGGLMTQRLALAGTALVVASGVVLFDFLQPRILARSSVAIAIEAVDATAPCPPAVILHARGRDFQEAQLFVPRVPRCPIGTAAVPDASEPSWLDVAADGAVVFWSAGIEEDEAPGRTLCERLPDTRIWMLYDTAGLGFTFAAAAPPSTWRPPTPLRTDGPIACGQPLPTEATRVAEARSEAAKLVQRGQDAAATDVLRQAAVSTFVARELFLELAQRLHKNDEALSRAEARYWAWRAVMVDYFGNLDTFRFYIELLLEDGRSEEALATLRRGLGSPPPDLTGQAQYADLLRLLRDLEAPRASPLDAAGSAP